MKLPYALSLQSSVKLTLQAGNLGAELGADEIEEASEAEVAVTREIVAWAVVGDESGLAEPDGFGLVAELGVRMKDWGVGVRGGGRSRYELRLGG